MAVNIGNKYLKAWLNFQHAPTEDLKGNNWTAYGNPTIGTTNAINGNALQLDGQSYLKLSGIELGGRDFYIDGWVYIDPSSPKNSSIISVVNPKSGYCMFSLGIDGYDYGLLTLYKSYSTDVTKYSSSYVRESTTRVGQRVHFKLVYRYTDKYFELCVNDVTVASVSGSDFCRYDRQLFDVYIGANYDAFYNDSRVNPYMGAEYNCTNGLIGSIDELRIYDGTWFSYNNENVPTTDDYTNVYFNCDIKADIHNSLTEWRYENAGTADLLTVSGTTVTGLTTAQSKTGTAFYQPTRAKCFDIPATKEIWIKCDIYTTANYTNGNRIRFYSEDSDSVNGWCTQTPISTYYQIWHNGTSVNGSNTLSANKNRPFLLHMLSDATNGIIEYFFIDGTTQKFTGNVNNGNDFNNVYIQMDGSNIYVSNLIISNFPVDITENVAVQNAALILNVDLARDLLGLAVWLKFDQSATDDAKGNTWSTYGNPTISNDNAITGNALQLDGQSCIISTNGIALGGRNFIVSGYCYIDPAWTPSSSSGDGWLFCITSTTDIHYTILRLGYNKTYDNWELVNSNEAFKFASGGYSNTTTSEKGIYPLGGHFLVSYNHNSNSISVSINGEKILSANCPKYNRKNDFFIVIGANTNSSPSDVYGYLKCAVDEFKVYDGIAVFSLDISLDTLRNITIPVTIDFDTCRDIRITLDTCRNITNPVTLNIDTLRDVKSIWRYENYGTADLLAVSGTTVTGLPITKSKTGSAFWQKQRVAVFPIPATKELWVKFDLYYGGTKWRAYDRLDGKDTGVGRYQKTNSLTSFINGPLEYTLNPQDSIETNQLKTYLLHMVSDAENGLVELWVDGVKYYSDDFAAEGLIYKGNVENGSDFEGFYLQSDDNKNLFSNVIISNARISLGENVLGLTNYFNFDTLRVVQRIRISVTINLDTLRIVTSNILISVTQDYDLLRVITTAPLCVNVDTLRILENVTMIYVTQDFATLRIVSAPVNGIFDTLRDLRRAWRYENYGTLALCVSGLKLYSGFFSSDIKTYEVPLEFSRTGYGYPPIYDSDNKYRKHFNVASSDEFWIKCDYYIDEIDESYILDIGYDSYSALIVFSKSATTIEYISSGSIITSWQCNPVQPRNIQRILLHLKNGNGNGILEVFVNNDIHVSYVGSLETSKNIYISSTLLNNRSYCALLSNIIISNKQLNISDDVSYIQYPKPITLDIGLYRDIQKGVWRYENIGTDDSLNFKTQTFTDLPATKSKTGVAFSQTVQANCFSFVPSDEVWLQFDIYRRSSTGFIRTGIYYAEDSTADIDEGFGDHFLCRNDSYHYSAVYDAITKRSLPWDSYKIVIDWDRKTSKGDTYPSYSENVNIPVGTLTTCLLHLKLADEGDVFSNGLIEFWLDGVRVFSARGNIHYGQPITALSVATSGEGNNPSLFSNILISNKHPNFNLLNFDTLRVLSALQIVNIDTARIVPHKVILSPVDNFGDEPDTSNDGSAQIQNWELQLSEQSLTDQLIFTTIKPTEIMEQVKGQYLDYKFDMRVESLKQRGILNTCTCCSDIDELLYKQLDYTVPEDEWWHNVNCDTSSHPSMRPYVRHFEEEEDDDEDYALASTHFTTIAGILGKQPVLQFADFVSTVDITAGGSTYNDLISAICGWTSRVPNIMINCYLRDDKLFVVQRGFESNVIDLTYSGAEVASVDKQLMRTMYGNSLWAKTEVRELPHWKYNDITSTLPQHNPTGDATYTYENDGLVSTTTVEKDGLRTVTRYEYTTLDSGRKFLSREETTVYDGNVAIDYQVTTHTPLSQGQSHVISNNEDGDYLGSVIGNSLGDDRVTPYSGYLTLTGANGEKIALWERQKIYDPIQQQRTVHGVTLFDSSFPIHGDDTLIEITEAIKWLNRKTQETITLNLFDYPHVIDFNDRIIFQDNVYYLKSNTAIKTSRIVNKQTLSLVRWY